jgi:FkbM family methyltransferase
MERTRMKKLIRKSYSWMQHHYVTFRILTWLKEIGITRKVNSLILRSNDKQDMAEPNEKMKASGQFYEQNHERLKNVLDLLADEKSKKVLGGVIQYRIHKTPISTELYSENDQYFVKGLIHISPGEVFIDGGAYTGDTIQQFMDTARRQKVRYKKIIAFEPDEKNYKMLSNYYGKKDNVELIKKGLSFKEDTLYFKTAGAAACIVDNDIEASYKVPVVNIDSVKACREATWIKMDIEGAEMDALRGAEETIKRNRPKLTICIYHSDEDMIRIIEYIHDIVPEYKLYVRHHSNSSVETVVYALI